MNRGISLVSDLGAARGDWLNPISINHSRAAATGKNELGWWESTVCKGRDNEAAEGAMNKTRRRNFASRAHLQRLVVQNGLCLLGTCRLLGAAFAPSPSSLPGTQGSSMCSCWILCLPPGEIHPGEIHPSEHLRLLKHRS